MYQRWSWSSDTWRCRTPAPVIRLTLLAYQGILKGWRGYADGASGRSLSDSNHIDLQMGNDHLVWSRDMSRGELRSGRMALI
jgi:hypothetical protein